MSPDLDALADVIAMAVERATAPLLERLAAAETRVAAVAGMEAAVTGLRERVVVAETKAAMVQPAPAVDLSPLTERLTALEAKSSGFADVRALDHVVTRLDAVERRPVEDSGVRDRVAALESKTATMDATLSRPLPVDSFVAPFVQKAEQAMSELTKDFSALRERVAIVETKGAVPGPPGPAGKDGRDGLDGKDGADGFGFEDLAVEQESDRSFTVKAIRGDRVKTIGKATFPVLIQRGVYAEGVDYERGDIVTFGGSQWHCAEPTNTKPAESKAWTLVVRRGRDGKDGKDAPGALPVVKVNG